MDEIWRKRGIVAALLVGFALLGVMTWMWSRARVASQRQAVTELNAGHAQHLQRMDALLADFANASTVLAADPAFVAYVLASRERGAEGIASVRDVLDERRADFDAESALLFDAGGLVVAGTGESERQAGRMGRWAPLLQVLERGETQAAWRAEGAALVQYALAPLRQGPLLEGVLVTRRVLPAELLAATLTQAGVQSALVALEADRALPVWTPEQELPDAVTQLRAPATDPAASKAPTPSTTPLQVSLLSAETPAVALVSLLKSDRAAALNREQQWLLVGLAAVATGVLALLGWIWRAQRRRLRQVSSGTPAVVFAAAQRSTDQKRGELLMHALGWADGAAPSPSAWPQGEAPALESRYRWVSFQGETALATLHRVDDRQLNRVVLLHLLHSTTPRDTARSLRIATELGKGGLIQHRNLASVLRVARMQAQLIVVTEDVAGTTLRELVERSGPLALDPALLVGKRVAAALQRLNEAGVLLRMLDPDQILLQSDGTVKLLPLALANPHGPAAGDLAFLSPEQWLAADRRSEVQMYGAWLERLLEASGTPLPAPLLNLLQRCTTSDATERLTDMGAVLSALDPL